MRAYDPPEMRTMLDALADATVVLGGDLALLGHDGNFMRVLGPEVRLSPDAAESAVLAALRPHLRRLADDAGSSTFEFHCEPDELPALRATALRVPVGEGGMLWVVRLSNRDERLKVLQEVRLATKFRALVRQHQVTAHDLKQPVAVIKMYTHLLSGRLSPDRDRPAPEGVNLTGILQAINEAAANMDDAVQAMLSDLTHTDEADVDFDATQELERVLAAIRAQAAQFDIAVTTRALPHAVMLRGSPDRFRQIVMNLGVNALEAMHGGEGGKLDVLAGVDGRELVLEVSDNGPGMDDDLAQRVFDMHFTTKASGHGVGLNGVLQNVTELGGSVRFETGPGEGCRFFVRLPIQG